MIAPLLLLVAAQGDPAAVRYTVKVVTKSWSPLELPEVEKLIETAAMPELSRSGAMRAEKTGFADVKGADYALNLDGRFIEEAESFSVYLTFGPGTKSELPSFHVSETRALGGASKQDMARKIEDAARSAGKKLAAVLAPQLEAARLDAGRPPLDEPVLPWTWGAIEVPRVANPTRAMEQLLDPRTEDHLRYEALKQIDSQVFDQQAARNVVETCVLRDPTPGVRIACARALGPVARTHVPTQRVLLGALRSEADDQVLAAVLEVAKGFVGLSRKETIETWLELVSDDATPSQTARAVADLLEKEGDVPNLDIAVARCLQQESLAYGKRLACAEKLLDHLPPARRFAVATPFLQHAVVLEQGQQQELEAVVEALAGRGSKPIDADLAELLLQFAERRQSSRHARSKVLYEAMRHPAPTPAVLQRVIALVADPDTSIAALRAVSELTDRAPNLRAMAIGALERTEMEWVPRKYGGDPVRERKETLERLKRKDSRN